MRLHLGEHQRGPPVSLLRWAAMIFVSLLAATGMAVARLIAAFVLPTATACYSVSVVFVPLFAWGLDSRCRTARTDRSIWRRPRPSAVDTLDTHERAELTA
jgi:hypothetical protein